MPRPGRWGIIHDAHTEVVASERLWRGVANRSRALKPPSADLYSSSASYSQLLARPQMRCGGRFWRSLLLYREDLAANGLRAASFIDE
jgi:hypothetical protein